MPAAFVVELCGYRNGTGPPNTSDSNDDQSVYMGRELFTQLGVPPGRPDPPGKVGSLLEKAVVERLGAVRPDLAIASSRPAKTFSQYRHLGVFDEFAKVYGRTRSGFDELSEQMEIARGDDRLGSLERSFDGFKARYDAEAGEFERLRRSMPEESLLKIDITVAVPSGVKDAPPELMVALSSKWSLRTDRAQDCVSQGNKLSAQRRGRMPHFGVVTIEPRPAMLKILADGSGTIDFVYHLDLPALRRTVEALAAAKRAPWSPKVTFDRMIEQGRLRDFDELENEVRRLPISSQSSGGSTASEDDDSTF